MTHTHVDPVEEGRVIPKCTNWFGHKFEARYSFAATGDQSTGHFDGTPTAYEQMVRAFQDKTYERDICVHCGFVIERAAPTTTTTR